MFSHWYITLYIVGALYGLLVYIRQFNTVNISSVQLLSCV